MVPANRTNVLQILIPVVIVSLISALLVMVAIVNQDFAKHNDPHEYAHLGKSIWSGEGLQYNGKPDVVLPPGFPIIIGAANTIIGDLEWSGKAVGLISFFICLFLIYEISISLVNEKFALLPVLLFAANSNVLLSAGSGYSESIFTLCFLLLVWLTVKFRDTDGVWPSLLFMILWPVLYYIRPEGLIIGLILYGWFVFDSNSKRPFAWLIPFVFLVLAFPYLFFLKQYTGNWQLSGKTYANLVLGELDSPYQNLTDQTNVILPRYLVIERIWNDPAEAKALGDYLKDPGNDIIHRLPQNLRSLVLIYWQSFSIVGILFMISGFVRMDSKKRTFLLSLFLPIGIYLLFFVMYRMVAIYHWMSVVFLTFGLIEFQKMLETRLPKYKSLLFGTAIVILCLYQMRSAVKIAVSF